MILLKVPPGGEKTVVGKMKPEQATPKQLRSRAGTGVEAPKQPRILLREISSTTISGCLHAEAENMVQWGSVIHLGVIVEVSPVRKH